MKINNLEFIKLLPQFMQEDAGNLGIAEGIDTVMHGMAVKITTMSTWDCIDKLSEQELDDLAWELNIEWYRKDAGIDVKRQLIKDSRQMSKKLGTKWAVEKIITTYFGDGYITEWHEYDGEPGHFKIFSSNPTITSENLMEFLNLLDKVKRASSHLDGIIISLTGMMKIHAGIAYHESSFETVRLGGKI